ncbi:hypothetical protein GCM10027059_46580 [Myceligenerans halotolerans]
MILRFANKHQNHPAVRQQSAVPPCGSMRVRVRVRGAVSSCGSVVGGHVRRALVRIDLARDMRAGVGDRGVEGREEVVLVA